MMKKGFTLIELIVVIAIIGVLGAGLLTLINPLEQIAKVRDAQRKQDLAQIQKALESYQIDNGRYPDAVPWGSAWLDYMEKVPLDPNGTQYVYRYDVSGGYRLFAKLERCSDTQIIENIDCNNPAVLYNYSVVSPNLLVEAFEGTTPPATTSTPTTTPGPISPPASTSTPTPTPTPTSAPSGNFKYVFVTSSAYTGNLLIGAVGVTTGLDAADQKCQSSAGGSSAVPAIHAVSNNFKAWISSSTTDPARRNWWQGEYRLTDGTTVVASNWTDLTDGTLQHAINKDEFGQIQSQDSVWTNTNYNGLILGTSDGYHCSNWTSAASSTTAYSGDTGFVNLNWTIKSWDYCLQQKALYCFEQ